MSSSAATEVASAPALRTPRAAPPGTRERRRALLRNLRHGLLALALLSAAVAAVLSLRPRAVPVDAARAERGLLVVAIEETGMTRVKDRYLVSSPTTGHVSRLLLEPGDSVRE